MPEGHYSFEAEMSRRLDDVNSRLNEISGRMETSYVRLELFEASNRLEDTQRAQLAEKVARLEARSEWLIRTIGAAIITGIIAVIMTVGKIHIGG